MDCNELALGLAKVLKKKHRQIETICETKVLMIGADALDLNRLNHEVKTLTEAIYVVNSMQTTQEAEGETCK